MHYRPGRISSISDAGDGKHSRVEVTHGKQKKSKQTGELTGYHRHVSVNHIPTVDAKNYAIGDRVHAGLDAATDPEPDQFDDQEDATEAEAIPGKSTPPKIPAKALGKAKGKFSAAMGKR